MILSGLIKMKSAASPWPCSEIYFKGIRKGIRKGSTLNVEH
jgi:hypothetical protein